MAELTRREQEVACLVAEGLTDPQVARTLFVSVRTVETHVKHAREKTGTANRGELARWWQEKDGSRPG